MVRTVEVEVNPVALAPGHGAQRLLGDVMFLGRAAWEADGPLHTDGRARLRRNQGVGGPVHTACRTLAAEESEGRLRWETGRPS